MRVPIILAVVGGVLASCAATAPLPAPAAHPPAAIQAKLAELVAEPNIGAIGIARIEGGKLAWSAYAGREADGDPVGPTTAFNTASVAKTLIAETTLRLADRGALSLDEPIAPHYAHPDLADDPRYAKLTPRLLLSHQAALKNWPFEYEDRKMAFIGEPGTGDISYSGAGIMMLARFLEAKTGKTYPELVDEVVLRPLGVEGIAVSREPWLDGRVPAPVDVQGNLHAPFDYTGDGDLIAMGDWNAADNLYATVPGYAALIGKLVTGEGLSAAMRAERQTLHSSSDSALGYVCVAEPADCPDPIGFGLGWQLFGQADGMVLNHSGNDYAEHAQVYFSPDTGDGLVMFMSGGEAFEQGLQLIELADPDLAMARHYRALFDSMSD